MVIPSTNIIKNIIFLTAFLLTIECSNLKSYGHVNDKFIQNSNLFRELISSKTENKNFNSLKIVSIKQYSSCNFINCSAPHGRCSDASTCICNQGYVNEPYLMRNKLEFCLYKQKNQLIAIFLELFFFFGIGHFYCYRFMIGSLKFVFVLVFFILYNKFKHENEEEFEFFHDVSLKKAGIQYIGSFIFACYFVLHFFDLVMMSQNNNLDGNGVPLQSFSIFN